MSHYTITVPCPVCAGPITTEVDVSDTRKGTISCRGIYGGYPRERGCGREYTDAQSDALDEAIWDAGEIAHEQALKAVPS